MRGQSSWRWVSSLMNTYSYPQLRHTKRTFICSPTDCCCPSFMSNPDPGLVSRYSAPNPIPTPQPRPTPTPHLYVSHAKQRKFESDLRRGRLKRKNGGKRTIDVHKALKERKVAYPPPIPMPMNPIGPPPNPQPTPKPHPIPTCVFATERRRILDFSAFSNFIAPAPGKGSRRSPRHPCPCQ